MKRVVAGLVLTGCWWVIAGCQSGGEPVAQADTQKSALSGQAETAQAAPAAAPQSEVKDEAKEAKEKERKLTDLLQRHAVAKQRLKKARLLIDQSEEDHKSNMTRMTAELNLAKRRLEDFEKNGAPQRIDRATLGVQWSEDSIKEQEEELAQLEITYKADEIATETKEIVLERARRRLERSRRDLVLQKKDLNTLKTETIPREKEEMKLGIENKEREIAAAQRNIQSSRIDRRMELMNAESDLAKIEQEISDLDPEALKKLQAQPDKDEPVKTDAAETKPAGEN